MSNKIRQNQRESFEKINKNPEQYRSKICIISSWNSTISDRRLQIVAFSSTEWRYLAKRIEWKHSLNLNYIEIQQNNPLNKNLCEGAMQIFAAAQFRCEI